MNKYEIVIIFSPDALQDEINTVLKRTETLISKSEGRILRTEDWGRKKLAYRIKKKREGRYYFILTESPGTVIIEIESLYLISEQVIRHMVIKLDTPTPGTSVPSPATAGLESNQDKLSSDAETASSIPV